MVDCDSQQDLSELVFRQPAEAADEDDIESYMQTRLREDAVRMNGGGNLHQIHNCGSLASAVRWPVCDDPTAVQIAGGVAFPAHRTECNLLYPFPFSVASANDNLYHVVGGTNRSDFE